MVRGIVRRLAIEDRVPTKEEDAILCLAVQQGIEAKDAMATMLRQHRGLALKMIAKWAKGSIVDDAMTEAMVGIAKAVERFDPSMGWKFSTYATYWISSRVRRMALESSMATRIPEYSVYRYRRMNKFLDAYRRQHGADPTDQEIMAHLDCNTAMLADLRRMSQFELFFLEDLSLANYQDASSIDAHQSPEGSIVDSIEMDRVMDHIEELPDTYRRILTMRFGLDGSEPMSLREIAATERCSSSNIEQKLRSLLKRLRRAIETS
jgi:RNA polymerase sigma factor (sigma-70 family)